MENHHINEKNLLLSTILNFVITIAEFIGGFLSNSLALISDAVHNLGDAFAVLLALIAHKISKRPPNEKNTFGYKRIEVLTALLNAVILLVITFFLIYEAWIRFHNPSPIKGKIMFIVAFIGLIANVLSVFLLHEDSHKNINIKAAYLHLIGDSLSSIAVIMASVLIMYFNVYWLDPLITVAIAGFIIYHTWDILKSAFTILMQSSPEGINKTEIVALLNEIEGIKNIHHIHIWSLSDSDIHFEAHIQL